VSERPLTEDERFQSFMYLLNEFQVACIQMGSWGDNEKMYKKEYVIFKEVRDRFIEWFKSHNQNYGK